MEKNRNDKVVFYGPLTVDKPCPIIKPNDKIQLQPTVYPVAIVPYISNEGEEAEEAKTPEELAAEEKEQRKKERRPSARVSGALMFVITLISAILVIFSAVDSYPIAAIEKYTSLGYFVDLGRQMVATNQYTQFGLVFVPYLLLVASVAGFINFVLSIVALITGKRMGYTLCAFVVFLVLAVAAFYQMKFFSGIKELNNLLSREYGWACIMLIIIGAANLLTAFVCSLICPKNKIVETVEIE